MLEWLIKMRGMTGPFGAVPFPVKRVESVRGVLLSRMPGDNLQHKPLVVLHRVHDLCPRWFHDSVENRNQPGGKSDNLLCICLTAWAMQIVIRTVAQAAHVLQVAPHLHHLWVAAVLQTDPEITVSTICLRDCKSEALHQLTNNVEDGVIGSADG